MKYNYYIICTLVVRAKRSLRTTLLDGGSSSKSGMSSPSDEGLMVIVACGIWGRESGVALRGGRSWE